MALVHSFINIFAGGRSDSKVFLFIVYAILLILLYLLLRKWKFPMRPRLKWFGLTLGALYLYGFFLHILYVKMIGVGLGNFFITGNNGELSSGSIAHTHIAKGFIGIILSKFGYGNLSTIDAGGAYMGLLPNILFYIGSFLLLAVLIQAVAYFSSSFQKILDGKTRRQKIVLVLGYSILSFSLIKTSIDGGILNYGFYVGLVCIAVLMLREKGKSLARFYYAGIGIAIFFILLSIYLDRYTTSASLIFAEIATLFLLYEIILYGSERYVRRHFLVPMILLFMGSWWMTGWRDMAAYSYGSTIIEKGEEIYVYDKKTEAVVAQKSQEQTSIRDLVKKNNDNENYMPVSIPDVTCMSHAPSQDIYMEILTDKPISPDSPMKTDLVTFHKTLSFQKENYWSTKFVVSMDQCTPAPLSVIDGILKKAGIDTYIIVNPIFDNGSDNF